MQAIRKPRAEVEVEARGEDHGEVDRTSPGPSHRARDGRPRATGQVRP